MNRILLYDKGVYSQMLLSSQKNTDQSLQELLEASGAMEAKKEITEVVSRMFAQDGSISVDALESRIDEILYGNKNAKEKLEKNGLASGWDAESNAPAKTEQQKRGIGIVLQAYYDLEDAKTEEKELNELVDAADQASEYCIDMEEAEKEANEKYNQFRQISELLTKRKDLQDRISSPAS